MCRLVLVLVLVLAHPARADRPLHGSFSAGGTLLVAGADSDHQRAELSLDIEPYSPPPPVPIGRCMAHPPPAPRSSPPAPTAIPSAPSSRSISSRTRVTARC